MAVLSRPGVRAVEVSEAAKLGLCSATYVAQASCPADCALRGAGCYAESGMVGHSTRRLAGELAPLEPRDRSPAVLAEREAECIAALSGRLPLRLHVVGDCRTAAAARIVGAAARRYQRRHGSPVWSYTHAWRGVHADSWGGSVSVLASCERPADVARAASRGYAAALIVPVFVRDAAYPLPTAPGYRLVPCPWQTRRVSCDHCGLCWDSDRLRRSHLVIGFTPHGSMARRVPLPMA